MANQMNFDNLLKDAYGFQFNKVGLRCYYLYNHNNGRIIHLTDTLELLATGTFSTDTSNLPEGSDWPIIWENKMNNDDDKIPTDLKAILDEQLAWTYQPLVTNLTFAELEEMKRREKQEKFVEEEAIKESFKESVAGRISAAQHLINTDQFESDTEIIIKIICASTHYLNLKEQVDNQYIYDDDEEDWIKDAMDSCVENLNHLTECLSLWREKTK